jgi:cellulose synthase/poly-beta-1,6-N-acetylglucosamine synthase-like glycosyltransferase
MPAFYFLAVVAIWLGLLSLRGGFRFSGYVRRELSRELPGYTPFVSIIAPFRGIDQGQKENFRALLQQDYPAYEVIFVTDRHDDPGIEIIRDLTSDKLQFVDDSNDPSVLRLHGTSDIESAGFLNDNLKNVELFAPSIKLVIAGPAVDSGQKVHNLLAAVAEIDPQSQALVFVDSDARTYPTWLRWLVAPLADEDMGAASGYRWFAAGQTSLAGKLRSVWNASIASALGAGTEKNFCWGGSTAIRRATFDRLEVVKRWRGSVSDDFTLTNVLHEAKLPIKFVPQCLILSEGDCSVGELLEFTTRQLKITRVYAAHLWKAILIGSSQFVLTFFGGLVLVLFRWRYGLPNVLPLALLAIIFLLGAAKSAVRLRAVSLALRNYELAENPGWISHFFLWPVASALFLYNALRAAWSRRITWRGISYELKSPDEAVIIVGDPKTR